MIAASSSAGLPTGGQDCGRQATAGTPPPDLGPGSPPPPPAPHRCRHPSQRYEPKNGETLPRYPHARPCQAAGVPQRPRATPGPPQGRPRERLRRRPGRPGSEREAARAAGRQRRGPPPTAPAHPRPPGSRSAAAVSPRSAHARRRRA